MEKIESLEYSQFISAFMMNAKKHTEEWDLPPAERKVC